MEATMVVGFSWQGKLQVPCCTRTSYAFPIQTNFTVTSLTACYLAYTRSAGVLYFVAGAIMCSFTVKGVKRILRQPRPVHLNPPHRKLTYGSAHSYIDLSLGLTSLLGCRVLTRPRSCITRLIYPLHAYISQSIHRCLAALWLMLYHHSSGFHGRA